LFGDIKTRLLTLPEIGMIAGTRMALGAGLGLLIGGRLSENARRGAGWALVAIGAASTIPLAMSVLSRRDAS